ncbi:choice-of-anchor A domain-containing protein, partial [Pseudarcicella hirudinis]
MKNFTASMLSTYGSRKFSALNFSFWQNFKQGPVIKKHAINQNRFLVNLFLGTILFIFQTFSGNLLAQNPLAPVQSFNVFTQNGISLNNGNIDGGIAAGGKVTLRGAFTISTATDGAFSVSGDANKTTLIAETGITYQSGTGLSVGSNGFMKIPDAAFTSTSKYWSSNPTRITISSASSQDAIPRINLSATQTLASIKQDVLDFNSIFTQLKATSDAHKNCSSNTAISPTGTSYTFTLTAGRSNFFKINASKLTSLTEIKFSNVPSATNPAIITVDLQSASSLSWTVPTFTSVPDAAGKYILFNFVNGASGATITLNGTNTEIGTLFAPYFNIVKSGAGDIEGQVVANTYTHEAGEVHYQIFSTSVTCGASSVTCDCAGGLLLNPSFEIQEDRPGYNSSYKTKYWEWSGGTVYTWTGYPVCDNYNAYLNATSTPSWIWQKVNNIAPGSSYTLSAYGGTHEPKYDHQFRLAFYNSAGTLLSFTNVQVDWDVDIVPSGQTPLKEYVLSGTAPANTSYLRVEGYASADYLKLDNLCLTVDNTCNNLTSGGTIGSPQTLCKNTGSTDPALLTEVTAPDGGDTGKGIEYQWYKTTTLINGACQTNMSGNIYQLISGANSATYDPPVITQTTCFIRTARRNKCTEYVGVSNAVMVVVKKNCTPQACTNNLVNNASFETDNGATNGGKKFPVTFMSSPASYITKTAVNTDAYRGAEPQSWSIGTTVNDYDNKNGAYYIDASATGNANSGDRFVYARKSQCVYYSASGQTLIPVTPGNKYSICAYLAAFNPTANQGDAKVLFEFKFRNGSTTSATLISQQDIEKTVTADSDGKWETLDWTQVCAEMIAPEGATYLEFYITPNDDEGDGVGIDDVCITEVTCPAAPAVANVSLCGSGSTTLVATGCTGTVKWYNSQNSTTPVFTGASYTTPTLTTSTGYFVTCTLNGCESTERQVTVAVNGGFSGVSASASNSGVSCGSAVQLSVAGTVTNPNLIANGDFSGGDTGFGSEYYLGTSGNGYYGVTTNANSYFSFAGSCTDHTSGSGNFMVADGSVIATTKIWYQKITVKPNTDYKLSAWAESINTTNPAKLYFTANGVKVGSTTTLSATNCQWQQFTGVWNSGANTSVTIAIMNENVNSDGNDFALDDISVTLNNPAISYSWSGPGSFTSTTQSPSTSAPGTYTVTLTSAGGCTATATTTVKGCPCPTLSNPTPSSTITICSGQPIPSLSLTSNQTIAGTYIEWCAFTTSQTNPYAMAGTMYCLQPEASLINGTVTATNLTGLPANTGTTDMTYYVYGCLKPVPDDASCRPFVSYIVIVKPIPAAPTVTPGAACKSGSSSVTVNLSASCASGQTPVWYADKVTTTALTTGNTYAPSIGTTTTYYVACKNTTTNCETAGADRKAVTATVNTTPGTPVVTGGTTICSGNSATLTTSGCTGGTYTWSNGGTTSSITVSPTVTTDYTVTCTVSGCTSASSAKATVTVNPIPSVPTATGGKTICSGESATLTASGCTGGTYAWSNGGTTSSITVSPTVTTDYTVTCTVSGCTSASSAKATVTVNPIPPVPTVTGGKTICSGESATLTASGCTGTYAWSNGGTTSSITVSPTVTTDYTVTCTVSGCTSASSTKATVTVNPIPPVPTVTGGKTICSGESATLTASGCTGTYTWSNGGATSSITVSPTVTTDYTVTCTVSGCTSASSTKATVTVNPIPPVPTVTGGTAICSGGSATLTASGCTGTYTWSNGGTTSSITVSPTVTTDYTVTCTVSGCTSASSTKATVTVNSIPPTPTVTGGKTICSGESATLTASGCTGTYAWSNGGTTSSITVSPTTTTTYTVTCKISGCTSASSGSGTITVNPIPPVPTVTGGKTICSGESATLTASGCTGTYAWSNGGTTSSITVSPTVTTDYTVTCTVSGCTSASSTKATVTVNSIPPVPTVTGGTAICSGGSATLTASGCTGGTYTWSNGGTTSSITVSPTVTTDYTVTCTISGCTSASSTKATVTVNSIPPTPTVTGGKTICSGESATLTASGCTGTYTWSNGGTTSSITVSPTVTTDYTVTCTVSGCTS